MTDHLVVTGSIDADDLRSRDAAAAGRRAMQQRLREATRIAPHARQPPARDLATRHQVLYFTCHPWTAELLDPGGGRTISLG